ncbi:MAG: bactofilin family protein [Patescibacteria group bacterium]|jgi:cytoskeletal protein CcmA (bactofilin family)|nr:polymer-forming cytoskeletal protein [Patescibacteria group bacterium]
MFKKDEKINDFNEAETIIGESVQVKGHFENNGNVVINGSLDGEIKTKGAILVGEKAKITANIQAEEMVVKGNIEGSIKVFGYLSIGETAKILGDIECIQISIEKGAQINGKVSISNEIEKEDKIINNENDYSIVE